MVLHKSYVMTHRTVSYALQQVAWLIRETILLVSAMGLGVKWIFMSTRMILYGIIIGLKFLPHLWWYATTPTVIRRVAYRVGVEDIEGVAEYIDELEEDLQQHHHHHHSSGKSPDDAEDKKKKSPRKSSVVDHHAEGVRKRLIIEKDESASQSSNEKDSSHDSDDELLAGTCYDNDGSFLNLEALEDVDVLAAYQATVAATKQCLEGKEDDESADETSPTTGLGATQTPSPKKRRSIAESESSLAGSQSTNTHHFRHLRKLREVSTKSQINGGEGLLDDISPARSPRHRNKPQTSPTQKSESVDGGSFFSKNGKRESSWFLDNLSMTVFRRGRRHSEDEIGEDNADDGERRDAKEKLEDPAAKHNTGGDDLEVKNRNNRAFLDIYLPVPVASLFAPRRAAPTTSKGTQQTTKTFLEDRKFPVAVCVTGGAWIIGSHFWMSLLAKLYALRGYIVFTPDYRNFPQATVEQMVDDVDDALCWVKCNCERFHGDPENITLVGQSAGGHLTMLSMLRQATIIASGGRENGGTLNNASLRDESTKKTEDKYQKNNSCRRFSPKYNPHHLITHYVGLSGFYDLISMLPYLDSRGLYRRVVFEICGGEHRVGEFSCVSWVQSLLQIVAESSGENNSSGNTKWAREVYRNLPSDISFVHGDADYSAPDSESRRLKDALAALRRVSNFDQRQETMPTSHRRPKRHHNQRPNTLTLVILVGANHTDPLVEEPLCEYSTVVEYMCFAAEKSARLHQSTKASHHHHHGGESSSQKQQQHRQEELRMKLQVDKMPLWIRMNRFICPF